MAIRGSILQSMLLCISTMALAANFDHHQLGQYYVPDQVTAPQVQQVTPAVIDFNGATGVVVSADGLVLTNHHVAKVLGDEVLVTRSLNGTLEQLQLLETRPDLDVAIYQLQSPGGPWASLRQTPPQQGEPVAVTGHPYGRSVRTSFGTVLTPEAVVGGIFSVEYSAQTWFGSSGSPVIDTQGQVLAVHWGWDSDRDYHGRLTGVPVSHLVARMPLVAAAADCPDPLATLHVRATVLESGPKTDRVRLTIHDEGACLSHVDRVVWHLHATFDEPDAEGWPGAPDFPVTIVAWGMFDLTATVYMGARVIELPGSARW